MIVLVWLPVPESSLFLLRTTESMLPVVMKFSQMAITLIPIMMANLIAPMFLDLVGPDEFSPSDLVFGSSVPLLAHRLGHGESEKSDDGLRVHL